MSKYYDVKGVAELLGLSIHIVYRLVRSGELPAYQFSGAKRISEDDLLKYIESHRLVRGKVLRRTAASI